MLDACTDRRARADSCSALRGVELARVRFSDALSGARRVVGEQVRQPIGERAQSHRFGPQLERDAVEVPTENLADDQPPSSAVTCDASSRNTSATTQVPMAK